MAKENNDNEVETVINADESIDVAVEKKSRDLVTENSKNISVSNLIEEFENQQLKKH